MRRVLGLALIVFAGVFFIFGGATGRLPAMLAALLSPGSLVGG